MADANFGKQSSQGYWDEWLNTQRSALEDSIKRSFSLQNQWGELFKSWKSNVEGDSFPNASIYQKMFTQAGQQYLDLLSQFHQKENTQKSASDITQEWLVSLQKFFGGMTAQPTSGFDFSTAYRNFNETMNKTTHAWQSAFQGGWPAANDWQKGFNIGSFDPMGFCASIPGLGYTREKQDALNELYTLWASFDREVQKYNKAMAEVGMDATQKFQEYLNNPPQDTPPLKSLKAVFAKWVDVCEDVYAKYALSQEYTDIYGDVVNALMSYKKKMNEIVDDTMEQMNLPTRKEIDSLHERVQVLRRENIQLKKDLAELQTAVFGKAKTSTKPASKKGKK